MPMPPPSLGEAPLKREIAERVAENANFNIGINSGEVAGQTIGHAHVHLIPRRQGDVPDPRGGVRGVIPGKAIY
jgi:diadenosine tetraphosphate (Ap4A) HIT family hydrolase